MTSEGTTRGGLFHAEGVVHAFGHDRHRQPDAALAWLVLLTRKRRVKQLRNDFRKKEFGYKEKECGHI
jgi:hypothetical protein